MVPSQLTGCVLGLAIAVSFSTPAIAQQPPAQPPSAPPQSAPQDDVSVARDLFREGSKLAEAGRWEAARDRFERSLKLKHAALTLYDLGIAQQETGHLVDAIESFRAFLAEPVEPTTQRYVEPVRAILPQLEARVAKLEIDVHPSGMRDLAVRVDGRDVAPSGGRAMVDPGRHQIAAAAPGYCEASRTISVTEGGLAAVDITLAPCAPSSIGLPAALAIGGLVVFIGGEIAFGVGARQGIGSPADADSAKGVMLAGNIAEGVGGLAAGVGVVMLIMRAQARPQRASIMPWSVGNVVGAKVTF